MKTSYLRRLEAAQKALNDILDKDADRFGPEFETILSAYRVIEWKADRVRAPHRTATNQISILANREKARAPRETELPKSALDGAAERR